MQVDPIRLKVDAFDQQFNDAGLFGREQLIPDRLELKEGAADLTLGKGPVGLAGSAPGLDDDFGGLQQRSDLLDDDSLDFGSGDLPDGASVGLPLHDALADIV